MSFEEFHYLLPNIKIVKPEKVLAHEEVDPNRCIPLAKKIKKDRIFMNPPIVTDIGNGFYMILDGANRTNAAKRLKLSHMPIQIVEYTNNRRIRLDRWNHLVNFGSIRGKNKFIEQIKKLEYQETIEIDEMPQRDYLKAVLGLSRKKYLAYICHGKEILAFRSPKNLIKKLSVLKSFVNLYNKKKYFIRRVNFKKCAKDICRPSDVLVCFFPFAKQEVERAFKKGELFPCGITRHLIPGRILHLDVHVPFLRDRKRSLEQKNRFIKNFVKEKIDAGKLRLYQDSIFVFES